MKIIAGIDVSKLSLDVWVSGHQKTFTNDTTGHEKLTKFLDRAKATRVVMEATGAYHFQVASHLSQLGVSVCVINPARSHYFARARGYRNKTDSVDARLLSEFGLAHDDLLEYHAPRESELSLRQLNRRRCELTGHLGRLKARLKEPALHPFEQSQLEAELAFVRHQIESLDAELLRIFALDAELQSSHELLLSIPGVGFITSCTILGEILRIGEFASAKQVAAYVGVCPCVRQSGSSLNLSSMSRGGNRLVRRCVYMASLAAIRTPGVFQELFLRMVRRGQAKKQAIVTVMHKLIRVAYGVLKTRSPFNPERALTVP